MVSEGRSLSQPRSFINLTPELGPLRSLWWSDHQDEGGLPGRSDLGVTRTCLLETSSEVSLFPAGLVHLGPRYSR